MRRVRSWRVVALAASLILVAAAAAPAAGLARNGFSGDFDLVDGDGNTIGHVTAQLFDPTDHRLVPGSYDFKGAPGYAIRESHSEIGHVQWWFDENNPEPGLGGSNVAFADGVECLYLGPGDVTCQEFAVMFIDDLDPALPDQVAFAANRDQATGEWAFDSWYTVGSGEFVLRFQGA